MHNAILKGQEDAEAHIPVLKPVQRFVQYSWKDVRIDLSDRIYLEQEMTWMVIRIALGGLLEYVMDNEDCRPRKFVVDHGYDPVAVMHLHRVEEISQGKGREVPVIGTS